MSDALDDMPVCPSGLRHMAFPTACGVRRVSPCLSLQVMSKSPSVTSVTTLMPLSLSSQFTKTLSGLISFRTR